MANRQPRSSKGFFDDRYRYAIQILIDRRREQRLSQEELGKRLGLHQQFVSRYELGERRLDVIEFADVAAVLGLDAVMILADILDE